MKLHVKSRINFLVLFCYASIGLTRGCGWEYGNVQFYSNFQSGQVTTTLCEIACSKLYKGFGASRRISSTNCYCMDTPAASTPDNDLMYKVNCGETLEHNTVSIGNTANIKVAFDFRDKPDDVQLLLFAVDSVDATKPSDRFMIQEGAGMLAARTERKLHRSNLTYLYNQIEESKKTTYDEIVEYYFFDYKLGDMGYNTTPLWFTSILSDDTTIKITQKMITPQSVTKTCKLLVNKEVHFDSGRMEIWYNFTTSPTATCDILNLSIYMQTEPGVKFERIEMMEHSMLFTESLINEKVQIFGLSRLPIDAFVSFNMSYVTTETNSLTGSFNLTILNLIQYSKWTADVMKEEVLEDQFKLVFKRKAYQGSVVRNKEKSVQGLSAVKMEKGLAYCIYFEERWERFCAYFDHSKRTTRVFPYLLSHLIGYDTTNQILYARTIRNSTVLLLNEEVKCYLHKSDEISYDAVDSFADKNGVKSARFDIAFPTTNYIVNQTGIYNQGESKYETIFRVV